MNLTPPKILQAQVETFLALLSHFEKNKSNIHKRKTIYVNYNDTNQSLSFCSIKKNECHNDKGISNRKI